VVAVAFLAAFDRGDRVYTRFGAKTCPGYPDITHVVEEPELDGDTLMFHLERSLAR
jgi:hypothetical protein